MIFKTLAGIVAFKNERRWDNETMQCHSDKDKNLRRKK